MTHTKLWRLIAGAVFATVALAGAACSSGSSAPPSSDGGGVVSNNGSDNNGGGAEPDTRTKLVYLSPTDHLVRASVALRGMRPSVEELEQVHADPEALPGIVDTYLESPAFGETVRDMHNEALLLRPFFFWFPPKGETARETTLVEFNNSVSEAPLKLIEHVVMSDRPYTEIVTADYTLADGAVAEVWGMDYQGDGQEWVETRWPEEDRVHAGVLTDSKVLVRHYSTPLNAQRSRANMVSRTFLCFDFLDNDINVDGNVDLSDPEAVQNAVKSPECASCHQALDPIAALFWKHEFFIAPGQIESYPFSHYRPEYETYRDYFTDRSPGFFGQPVNDLRELGIAMGQDPRFAMCAVKRFYSYLAQVPMDDVPIDVALDLHTAFAASGLRAKALARSVVLSDAFRASHTQTPRGADHLAGLKIIRPRQWSRMMDDLVGFRWEVNFDFPLDFLAPGVSFGTVDLFRDSLLGYEVLAGGTDDFVVTRPVHAINPTASLVYENFAFEAAGAIVERDLNSPSTPPLASRLLRIDKDQTDEALVRAELAWLHKKLFAELVEPDSETVDASWELFRSALDLSGDPLRTWKVVLAAMFQDSRLLLY